MYIERTLQRLLKRFPYQIRDNLIIVAGTMIIRKAIRMTIQITTRKVIAESDAQIDISLITKVNQTPTIIKNLFRTLKNLTTCIRDIQFDYYNKKVNKLTNSKNIKILIIIIMLYEVFRKLKRKINRR